MQWPKMKNGNQQQNQSHFLSGEIFKFSIFKFVYVFSLVFFCVFFFVFVFLFFVFFLCVFFVFSIFFVLVFFVFFFFFPSLFFSSLEGRLLPPSKRQTSLRFGERREGGNLFLSPLPTKKKPNPPSFSKPVSAAACENVGPFFRKKKKTHASN